MGLIDSIISAESGGDANAKNPNSSASGPSQFIDSTWLSTFKSARPDLAQGKTDDQILALKTDPQISREMTEAYANQNGAILSKNGLPVTDGNTYLAHFAGPGGAVKVLQADPTAPVESILGPAAVKANPFLRGMTAGDLQAWAAKKVGGSTPQPQASPASPAGPPGGLLAQPAQSGMPLNIAPQAPPIFAPPQQPQQQAQAPQAPFEPPAPMEAAPIFFAPKRPIDLSKLRAAFQAPAVPRG